MLEFTAINHFDIKGRGHVIVVENDKDRQRDNCGLIGETVLIDAVDYKIMGVESYAVAKIRKGQEIGLLVQPTGAAENAT